jgi:hypothetical protein
MACCVGCVVCIEKTPDRPIGKPSMHDAAGHLAGKREAGKPIEPVLLFRRPSDGTARSGQTSGCFLTLARAAAADAPMAGARRIGK